MIHSIAVNLTEKLNIHVQKEGKELQKMVLGMEILLINLPKIIIMLIFSLFLGILPQTFITLFSFAFIRRYVSGLHASGDITCTLITAFMFVLIPYLLQGVWINSILLILIFICTGIGIFKYAPADTSARPLLGKNKRKRLKNKAMVSNAFILVLALVIRNEEFYILFSAGAVYATICILPLTYKIFKRSVNNYEQYEQTDIH